MKCQRPKRMRLRRTNRCARDGMEPGRDYQRVVACMSRAEFRRCLAGNALLTLLLNTPDETERRRIYNDFYSAHPTPGDEHG
jgi:hypothetical protein